MIRLKNPALRMQGGIFVFRVSLNIRRAEAGEKIFRQTKQNFARVVYPTRRNFVTYDGKGFAMISCDEFLEVPFNTALDRLIVRCGGAFRLFHRLV